MQLIKRNVQKKLGSIKPMKICHQAKVRIIGFWGFLRKKMYFSELQYFNSSFCNKFGHNMQQFSRIVDLIKQLLFKT